LLPAHEAILPRLRRRFDQRLCRVMVLLEQCDERECVLGPVEDGFRARSRVRHWLRGLQRKRRTAARARSAYRARPIWAA
jgi:hypothetical protein